MNIKLSVCIITNVIDDMLIDVIKSFMLPELEIVVGYNQLKQGNINDLYAIFPNISLIDLKWEGYGTTKNKLAHKASSDWILSIDSDEIADNLLQDSLKNIQLENTEMIYQLKRIQKIGNHIINHGSFGAPEWKPRIYNRKFVIWNTEKVHESLIIPATFQLNSLNGTLWHKTSETLDDIKAKNKHYAILSAENMFSKGKKATAIKPYISGIMSFIKQYFLKLGFLDGKIGFQLAITSFQYNFMKYALLRKMY